MLTKSDCKIILSLSMPLAILVIITSSIGISTQDFYAKETLNWQLQSIGQDIVDLFLIAPCLIITSILAFRNNKTATLLWGGVVLYITYTFVIFCFDIHFNKLFILYCIILSLSFYSFMFFLFTQSKVNFSEQFVKKPVVKFIGIYFIIIPIVFYFLWLSEILPAIIDNTTPQSLIEVGLPTNPVQVLDLSVFLPGILLTGILLLKRNAIALVLTPVILVFFVLMDITIGFLIVFMKNKGLEGDLSLAIIMSVLALFSLVNLIWYLKSMKRNL